MSNVNNKSLPFWRIDAGRKDNESLTRQMARRIDSEGNKDGNVSLSEIDAFEKKLDAIMGSPGFSAWTDPTHDPVKKQAWVDHNTVYSVREQVAEPNSLVTDLARKNFGGVLEGIAALWWFGGKVTLGGDK